MCERKHGYHKVDAGDTRTISEEHKVLQELHTVRDVRSQAFSVDVLGSSHVSVCKCLVGDAEGCSGCTLYTFGPARGLAWLARLDRLNQLCVSDIQTQATRVTPIPMVAVHMVSYGTASPSQKGPTYQSMWIRI